MFKRGTVARNRTLINILISKKITANQLWLHEINYSLIHLLHKNAKSCYVLVTVLVMAVGQNKELAVSDKQQTCF